MTIDDMYDSIKHVLATEGVRLDAVDDAMFWLGAKVALEIAKKEGNVDTLFTEAEAKAKENPR